MAKNIKLPEATDSTLPATLANGTNGSHGTNGTSTVSPTIARSFLRLFPALPKKHPLSTNITRLVLRPTIRRPIAMLRHMLSHWANSIA